MLRMTTFFAPALLIAGLGLTPSTHGAVLANYTFEGDSLVSSDTNLESLASSFVNGGFDKNGASAPGPASLQFKTENSSRAYGPNITLSPADDPVSDAAGQFVYSKSEAVAEGYFFLFSVEANSGSLLNLDSLDITTDRNGAGFQSYAMDVSSNGIDFTQIVTNQDFNATRNHTISGFEEIPEAFVRISIWRSPGGQDGLRGVVDDIVLNGTVSVIPEPASLALLGLGGLLLTSRRR